MYMEPFRKRSETRFFVSVILYANLLYLNEGFNFFCLRLQERPIRLHNVDFLSWGTSVYTQHI